MSEHRLHPFALPTRASMAIACGLVAVAGPAVAQEAQRQAAPHVHGAGTLAIAIENTTVEMQLDAPGFDIVGFEHEAKTAANRKALAGAKATLAKPLGLFELPEAARCTVKSAKVAYTGGGDHHGHDHGHSHGHSHGAKPAPKEPAKSAKAAKDPAPTAQPAQSPGQADAKPTDEHAEFRATYVLACARPASLTTLGFPYFKRFKGAEKLTVTVVGPKGQTQGVATRDKPRLDLAGLM